MTCLCARKGYLLQHARLSLSSRLATYVPGSAPLFCKCTLDPHPFGAKFGIAEAISSLHRTFILLTCVLLNGEFRLKSTSLSTA